MRLMASMLGALLVMTAVNGQLSSERRLGKMQEVFAWKQLTYEVNNVELLLDRIGNRDSVRSNRQASDFVFLNTDDTHAAWNTGNKYQNVFDNRPTWQSNDETPRVPQRPTQTSRAPSSESSTTTARPNPRDEAGAYFIKYNNVPMGVERVGNRLFVTVPRRRYGIPSTLNTIDLSRATSRSPSLQPYPDIQEAGNLFSVYRTRADSCNRLWMVDTGMLEIPGDRQQIQPPAIVVFDLNTDSVLFRYNFKSTDIITRNTPAGLASITVDVDDTNCGDAYAYVPDLATYGLIVYSLRANDSWRFSNNYFSFNPLAGNLNIGGNRFQWSDGIFSITLSDKKRDGCRTAYFHPLVGFSEFSVSTCTLRNSSAVGSSDLWMAFNYVGERGPNSQSSAHGYHSGTGTVLFAAVGSGAVGCWRTAVPLAPRGVAYLARDDTRLMYPSDLHITGDEVWVMANSMPRFIYSTLDTEQYNFYIYRANVQDLISGTTCESRSV